MSEGTLPPITSVRGGAYGTEAHYERMLELANEYDAMGGDLREQAGLGARVMADGDLLESAVLSPLSFAEAEADVLGATTGLGGLLVRSLELEADALLLRATVMTYRSIDELQQQAYDVLDYTTGRMLAYAAPGLVLGGGAAYLTLVGANPFLTPEQRAAIDAGLVDGLQAFAEDNPELVQHLINGGGGLVDGLQDLAVGGATVLGGPIGGLLAQAGLRELGIDPFHPDLNSAARDIAGLYDDGEPDIGEPKPGDSLYGAAAPGSVTDLMRHLQDANDQRHPDGHIEIQTLQLPDGTRRYIAYLPGTDDMGTLPGQSDGTIRDMGANLRLVGGDDTAYARGIVEALNEVTAGDPDARVMLVGHSQGGMTAAELAAQDPATHNFTIDQVVTAGAPTAQVPRIPESTGVLSLENSGDVVPLLDGEDNPEHVNRTTVRFDSSSGDIAFNHDMSHYVQGGAAVDQAATVSGSSLGPSVQQMRDQGFLDHPAGTTATVTTYDITRSP
ncbi:MAG TPA: hypothetical protein VLA97_17985 [Nocardioidaceae bacterium]|nr:hypothetical protein [Nocardioidaceae bacterium]